MTAIQRILLGIVVLAAAAAGSFYAGMLYGKSQERTAAAANAPAVAAGQGRQGFAPGQVQGGFQQRFEGQPGTVLGQIEEISQGTMFVADANGAQIRVHVTDTTLIEKQASVTLADLKPGETVLVSGNPASDGSITARSVQVSPAGRFVGATPGPARRP